MPRRKMLAGLSVCNRRLVQGIESVALLTCSQRLIGYLLQQIVGASFDLNQGKILVWRYACSEFNIRSRNTTT